jgi:HD-GYP domain-containing protein (c-di-GMP phosphodiesterase class II)
MPPQTIPVDSLRVGLFIQLEQVKWLAHPFLFNSFKIKGTEQIQILKNLGISEVIYFPEKSDCAPAFTKGASKQGNIPQSPPIPPPMDLMWSIKKRQTQRMQERRQQIQKCEKDYNRTIERVSSVMRKLVTGSPEAAADADQLIQGIVESLLADPDAIVHLVNVKSKDETLFYHTLNVAILALVLGKEYGLNAGQARLLGLGALFHDVGKQKIGKNILYKQGQLTPPELKILRMHPLYGYEIMSQVESFPPGALPIIVEHHETTDGTGYPRGLGGDELSILSKITSIANNYDGLCNKLDPMESMTPYEALCHLFCRQKEQLDSQLLSLFISCLGVYPPGTVVKLNNESIGMVVSINPKKPLRPGILMYDPNVPKNEALLYDLEEFPDLEIDRSLRPSQLPQEVYHYLDPRTRVNYFYEATKNTSPGRLQH